jgi:translation elongation factor EF-Ts
MKLVQKLQCILQALNPLALDKDNIDKNIIDKEMEIIKAEITNAGKPD